MKLAAPSEFDAAAETTPLSVCVIGRNEAANLPALFASLAPLRRRLPGLELVFVDSASTDDSVAIARSFCDVIVRMPDAADACAALNRYWGTLACSGEYVLYLDGDMQLEAHFVTEVERLIDEGTVDGIVGDYTDVFPDGGIRAKALGRRLRPGPASHFGGAVVLRRATVLKVGNWNPRLFAWEENELYTRMVVHGHQVQYVARPMVRHLTARLGPMLRLWGCISPAVPGVGQKFYGFGQVLASRYRARTLWQFIRGFPEPFVVWAALALACGMVVAGLGWVGLMVLAFAGALVAVRRGPALFVVYGLLPLQALMGFRRQVSDVVEPDAVERASTRLVRTQPSAKCVATQAAVEAPAIATSKMGANGVGAPTKVLAVIGQLDVGGTERHLLKMASMLNGSEIEMHVFAMRGGELESRFRATDVDTIVPRTRLRGIPRMLIALWQLARCAWRLKPAIIHFYLPAAYVLGSLATLGVPAYRVMSRRSLANYQAKYPGLRRVEMLLHNFTGVVIGNSRAVIRDLMKEGLDSARIAVIYNGVAPVQNPGGRAIARERLGIDASEFVMVCVANLIPYKGHSDLLDAVTLVRAQLRGKWKLLMVGRDDGIGTNLRHQARLAGIQDHVRWVGGVENVDDYLAAADVGVLASHEEGFSNAVLEGMAAGLPMVVTDVGGNAEAVTEGECGFVVPPRDPASLGAALLRLSGDSELRERLGAAARARALECFDENTTAALYRELYLNLASGAVLPVPLAARPGPA